MNLGKTLALITPGLNIRSYTQRGKAQLQITEPQRLNFENFARQVVSKRRVSSRNGMVAAAHPLATAAGIDTLRNGGNAMDAAIATALTTTVTLPASCGLGGDVFLIYYEAKSGEVFAVNGSGIAPRTLSRDYFASRGYEKMPFVGPLSIGVPGAVDAYFQAISRWCRLGADSLFKYAIHYAEEGFPLSDGGAKIIVSTIDDLSQCPWASKIFLRDGAPPGPAELLVQSNLANSLRTIQSCGPEAFYEGDIAVTIADAIQSLGGELSTSDLAGHKSDVYEPISTTYRGYSILQTAPPSQGHILLEELNIIENADLSAAGHNSANAIHLMVEAKKRAFSDRNAYSRDPLFGKVPLQTLISKEFAAERFATIDHARVSDDDRPGALPEMSSDTTYLCTADAEGNMVSLIHSLSAGFGSRVVGGATGIMLNNRVGRGFSLVPGHPNVIEGGKRTMHTLNAFAVSKDGQVLLVGGTPGGDQQVQWNMQVISNLIDHDMDVQSAVDAPRWVSFPGTDPQNLPNDFELRLEARIPGSVADDLARRGHVIKWLDPYSTGGAVLLIARDPSTGVLHGGSDPRTEGGASGI